MKAVILLVMAEKETKNENAILKVMSEAERKAKKMERKWTQINNTDQSVNFSNKTR